MTALRPAILLALAAAACGHQASAPVERVALPAGSSFGAMTDTLVAHGVVRHRLWFRLLARLGRYDRTARAGLYELRPGERALDVLRALRAGGITMRLTVPEGYTLVDVAGLAQRELGLAPDSVLAAAREPPMLAEFGVSGASLEAPECSASRRRPSRAASAPSSPG